jgi:hypothetical protein
MKSLFAAAALAAVSLCCAAQQATERSTYKPGRDPQSAANVGQSGSPSGSATGALPFDKTYTELTPEQKKQVRSSYVNLGEADEPPYPADGMKALYGPITKAQARTLITGKFRAEVEVDREGHAVSIAVFETSSEEMTRMVAGVALLIKYKPALCRGVPCAMNFPIRVGFAVE